MSITFSNVPTTARASALYIEQEAVQRGTGSAEIPHKIFVLGQYNSGYEPEDNVPKLITSKEQAWTLYGRGSMLARLLERTLENCGSVAVYAVPLADGSGAATGKFEFSGTASAAGVISGYIEGEKVSVSVAKDEAHTAIATAMAAAINADLDLPVTATVATGVVTLVPKWKGESANGIDVAMNLGDTDATPAGITATATDMASGEGDPVLTTALGNMGGTWYTEVVCPYNSAASLTALASAGDDRDEPGVRRQFVAFVGYTDTYANYLTKLDSLNSQWLSFIPVHESPSSPYMISASAAAIWAKYQTNTPGRPVKTLKLPDIIGATGNDLTQAQRNAAVLAGGSYTVNRSDNTVQFGDVCTTRTTTDSGGATEDWQFAIIIPNIQFKIYALEQKFLATPYDRGVVVADGPGKKPTYAVTPKMVKTAAIGLVDDWIERGLSTTRDDIVDNITSEINSSNPGRIDLLIPDVASAGLRIVATKLEWGFVA